MLITFLESVKQDFEDNIKVSEDGVTESVQQVRDLKLNPTESKEYRVDLVCAASGSYYIYIDYEEKEDGGMKPFVEVTVKLGDEVVYEGSLAALLEDGCEPIQLEGELHAEEPLPITVCYLMPRDVGNEAQGTYADFDLHLKIEKS
jgi:hypothetical protein